MVSGNSTEERERGRASSERSRQETAADRVSASSTAGDRIDQSPRTDRTVQIRSAKISCSVLGALARRSACRHCLCLPSLRRGPVVKQGALSSGTVAHEQISVAPAPGTRRRPVSRSLCLSGGRQSQQRMLSMPFLADLLGAKSLQMKGAKRALVCSGCQSHKLDAQDRLNLAAP